MTIKVKPVSREVFNKECDFCSEKQHITVSKVLFEKGVDNLLDRDEAYFLVDESERENLKNIPGIEVIG